MSQTPPPMQPPEMQPPKMPPPQMQPSRMQPPQMQPPQMPPPQMPPPVQQPPRCRSSAVTVLLILLISALAFVGGGFAMRWFTRDAAEPAPVPTTTAPATPSVEPTTPSPEPEPTPTQASVEAPPADDGEFWSMSDAIFLAELHEMTCMDERHPHISSFWCSTDDGTVRMYIGGTKEGNLKHVSVSTPDGQYRDIFHELWPKIGLLLMDDDELDLLALLEFNDRGIWGDRYDETHMGGRTITAMPNQFLIFTTEGWADGLTQPSFSPQMPEVEQHLSQFGDFECDAGMDGSSFSCPKTSAPSTSGSRPTPST